MRPGAWTGSIVTTDGDIVRKSVTKERWKAVQSKIQWLAAHVDLREEYLEFESNKVLDETLSSPGKIEFDTTERFVGF